MDSCKFAVKLKELHLLLIIANHIDKKMTIDIVELEIYKKTEE